MLIRRLILGASLLAAFAAHAAQPTEMPRAGSDIASHLLTPLHSFRLK